MLTDLPFARNRLFRVVRGQKLPEWAADFDAATSGQFFLKYLLANEAVTSVIPGTGNLEHIADNLGAGRGRLPDAAQRARMVAFFEGLRCAIRRPQRRTGAISRPPAAELGNRFSTCMFHMKHSSILLIL